MTVVASVASAAVEGKGKAARKRPTPPPPTPAPVAPPQATRPGEAVDTESSSSPSHPARPAGSFVLGFLAWAWIGLPFVKGGPTQVRNVWRAKFLNRGPDGNRLP